MHEFIHLGMYVAKHKWICMWMYVHSYELRYVCIYVCMCTKSNSTSLYTYFMSLNKYDYHIAHITHYAPWEHSPDIFGFVCQNTAKCNTYLMLLPCFGQQQICLSICNIYRSVHIHVWYNCASIHTSHELSAINNVIRGTAIYIICIIAMCQWRNMPATL